MRRLEMSIPIKFVSEDDELAAYKVFTDEGESYYSAPGDVFYVTRRMVEALQKAGIKFEDLEKNPIGAPHVAHP